MAESNNSLEVNPFGKPTITIHESIPDEDEHEEITENIIGHTNNNLDLNEAYDEKEALNKKAERAEKSKTKYQNKLHRVTSQNIDLKNQLRQYQDKLSQKEQAERDLKEEKDRRLARDLEDEVVVTQAKIIQARADGDVAAEIENFDYLSQLRSDLNRFEILKSAADVEEEEISFEPINVDQFDQDQIEDEIENEIPEPLASFFDKNSWADPQSKSFNQVLHAQLVELSQVAEQIYIDSGDSHLIGTEEFYNTAAKIVLENNSKKNIPNPSSRPRVDGVLRPGNNMADVYANSKGANGTTLTPDELRLVENITLRAPDGRIRSLSEKIQIFEQNKSKPITKDNYNKITIDNFY